MNLLISISCLIYTLIAEYPKVDEKESLNKGYIDKPPFEPPFGGWDPTLSWVVRDLVQEVKGYKQLVTQQGEMLEKALDQLDGFSEQGKMLKKVLEQLDGLENRIDVMRSEVRLISQQKLTWQNSTHANRLFSDFAVDGVYLMQNDDSGTNPISHTKDSKVGANNMIMIDLGALFKIHTVKLWKRVNTCCDHRQIGLLIYADDTLIGATSDAPYLYNLRVSGNVYGSKIYVKQPKAETVNFLEIQVFGTGPFGKDEIDC